MSYILHFQSLPENKSVSVQDIREYFGHRENYSVNDYQALYSNEDTGVYFTFEYGGYKETPDNIRENILPVYFNISYSRSHIFVLEAEPELAEFIRNFNLLVSDLWMKGSQYSAYNELDFYRGWSSGNEAYYKNILRKTPDQRFISLPVSLIEKCWRWNYHINSMQAELGREIVVPRILFIEYQGIISTTVIWTDAMPVALPKVDTVILYRKQLSPRMLLKKTEDIALVRMNELEPLLSDYPVAEEHLSYYTVIYHEPPKDIRHFFQTQKTTVSDHVRFIPVSEVHDKELIEKVLRDSNILPTN